MRVVALVLLALAGAASATQRRKLRADATGRDVDLDDSMFRFLMESTAPPAAGEEAAGADASARRRTQTTAGTETLTGSLYDTGCFETRAGGSWGFCGGLSCKDTYVTSTGPPTAPIDGVSGSYAATNSKNSQASNAAGTFFTADTAQPYLERSSDPDHTNWSPGPGPCVTTCTQSTADVCSASFLASTLTGDGVRYAYCNDKWLIITSDGSPGGIYTPNMDDTPFPPGGSCSSAQQDAGSGADCRTGMETVDETRPDTMYFPLNVEDLATSAPANNVGVYECGDGTETLTDSSGGACGASKTHRAE